MALVHKGQIPVQWVFKHDATGAQGTAYWKDGNGVEFCISFRVPQERLAKIWSHLSAKSPYGADEIGFFSRIRKAVSRGVLKQVVNTIKQATLIPQATRLAGLVAQKTGLPIDPGQIGKAYDFAVAIATRNPKALAMAKRIVRTAALGNPKALAALTALRAVSGFVPAVKKITQPVIGAEPAYGYPYGAAAPQFGSNMHALPQVATCLGGYHVVWRYRKQA